MGLQPRPHGVAASLTWGCSLARVGLQAPGSMPPSTCFELELELEVEVELEVELEVAVEVAVELEVEVEVELEVCLSACDDEGVEVGGGAPAVPHRRSAELASIAHAHSTRT